MLHGCNSYLSGGPTEESQMIETTTSSRHTGSHTASICPLLAEGGGVCVCVKGRKHVNISFRGVNRFCRLETWGAFRWGVWFSYSGLLGLHAYSSPAALWIRLKSILLSEQTTQLVMLCKKNSNWTSCPNCEENVAFCKPKARNEKKGKTL